MAKNVSNFPLKIEKIQRSSLLSLLLMFVSEVLIFSALWQENEKVNKLERKEQSFFTDSVTVYVISPK